MLITLIIIDVLAWIATFFIKGITLYTLLLVVPTVMFAARKYGIHCKLSSITTIEVLFLIFSTTYQLLFGGVNWVKFALVVLCRIVALSVVIYDSVMYVYVEEEKKK